MNKKILLIEDDQIFSTVYRKKLLQDGFEVEIAPDGEAGLELVHRFHPDAVLLDLMLPKLPGVDFIKKIRSEPEFARLPVVVFTNSYLTGTVQEARNAGATKCLAKADCTPGHVIETLRSVLDSEGTPNPPAGPAPDAVQTAAGPAPPGPAPGQRAVINPDDEFQDALRKSFIDSLPFTLTGLRTLLQGLIKAENEAGRLQQVQQLYRRVRALTNNASIVGLFQITQMTDALEALLKELHDKPKNIHASTLRTVASAIDFLGVLFEQRGTAPDKQFYEASILVVDDEATSRRAIDYALEKARLKSVSVGDPVQALQLLCKKKFDLIFLDVDMPSMNGYELCSKLRTLPSCKKTPVVFVTGLNDFESRANSSMSGGNDFIAKPFLFIELAVRALVYVWRGRLESAKNAPDILNAAQNVRTLPAPG